MSIVSLKKRFNTINEKKKHSEFRQTPNNKHNKWKELRQINYDIQSNARRETATLALRDEWLTVPEVKTHFDHVKIIRSWRILNNQYLMTDAVFFLFYLQHRIKSGLFPYWIWRVIISQILLVVLLAASDIRLTQNEIRV